MDSIFTRRSVRQFCDKKVEDEKIEKLIKAAMHAPSAFNQQAWEFIVVRGRENLVKLSDYNEYAKSLKTADTAIIILGNTQRMILPEYWEQDLGAATQNILVEATELELGAVWLGAAPEKSRMKYICDLYNLDKNLLPFAVISVGYPKHEGANKFVDRYDASRVRYID